MGSNPRVLQKFGKYEIVGELGQGGMGVVYKARDPAIGRLVALKTLTPELLSNPELLERFYREARSAGSLQHPNVVTIYDLGESDGRPYIAMEFVEGQSLQKLIAQQSPIPLPVKLKIISQFCQGLDHAHKHGVVHRDIKPGNILVRSDGTVKVVDFGIAHLDSTTITKTGVFMGTVHYSSPEQLNDGRVDARSDIWSVAIVMYEFLTYHKPFEGANIGSLIAKILNSEPTPLRELCPEAPAELEALVARAMHKRPDERPQSLEDMLLELAPIEQSLRFTLVSDLVTQAQDFWKRGELLKAQEKVRNVLAMDSTHTEAKSLMSRISTEIRRLEAAPKVLKLVGEGEQLLSQGESAKALELASQALRLIPNDKQALDLKKRASEEQSRRKQTREAVNAGEKAFHLGDLTGAEVQLKKALSLDPQNAQATLLLETIQKDRIAREKSFRLKEALWEAENLLKEEKYEEVIRRLEQLKPEYPGEKGIADLIGTAREKQAEQAARAAQVAAAEQAAKLNDQLTAATQSMDDQDFEGATRILSDIKKEFPQEKRVRELFDLAQNRATEFSATQVAQGPPSMPAAPPLPPQPPTVQPRVEEARPAPMSQVEQPGIEKAQPVPPPQPPVAAPRERVVAPQAPVVTPQPPAAVKKNRMLLAVAGAAVVLILVAAVIYLRSNRSQPGTTPGTASAQAQQTANQAQQLFEQGKLDEALSTWRTVASEPGPLQAKAKQAIDQIQKVEQQEQSLMGQAQAAQAQKKWASAEALYQQVVALNGNLKDQALQSIKTLKAVESGQDLATLEKQKYTEAMNAYGKKDYAKARNLFQQVINLNVPDSKYEDQAKTKLADVESRLKQATELRASLDKFKALAGRKDYSQARAMIPALVQEGGDQNRLSTQVDAMERADLRNLQNQFKQAQASKSAQQLKALKPKFQALASQGGPAASEAADYANNRISKALAEITSSANSRSTSPGAKSQTASSNVTTVGSGGVREHIVWGSQAPAAPKVTMVTSGPYQIDGGLKAVNMKMPRVKGAPANSVVTVKINIDPNGDVTSDHIVKDDHGLGASVLQAVKQWKFQPPRVKGKPVSTSVLVKVQF